MLRTIIIRSFLIRGAAKKEINKRLFRAFSIELSRNRTQTACDLLSRKQTNLQWLPNLVRCYADFPSHIKVPLPALSPTMEEGTLVSWAKKEGDKLNEGDLLAEIETDKATMAFETPEEGYLAKILIPAGTKGIPVGKLVCIIVEKAEDVAAFKDFKDDAPAPSKAKKPAPSPPTPAAPSVAPASPPPPSPPSAPATSLPSMGQPEGGRVYASPMARRLAEQRQIRLQGHGTGLFGSITSKDLDHLGAAPAAAAGAPAPRAAGAAGAGSTGKPSPYVDLPVSNMRAVIAKRLLQSKQTIPHFYVSGHFNIDKLLDARVKFNKKLEKQKIKLSVNDFVVKACAYACNKVPEANSFWMDTFIRQNTNCDISIAVATDKGLLTPIIFGANTKGLVQISKEIKSLAAKAREGKLQPHEFQGGTFTVSNLGMFGTTNFSAIINPPQSCILAVGTSTKTVVPDDSIKGFKTSNMMWVTLSADHRVVDGAVAAQWMQAFTAGMTDPENMLL